MLRYHSRDQNSYSTNDHFPPISRTLRYKKVTKPLLERKRRARMNKCLDELKDLVCAMEADGENINKLEKADILELTVRHLKRISRLQDPIQEAHRFQAGFSQCANEVCTFLVSLPGLNSSLGSRLLEHLKQCISKHHTPYPMVMSSTNDQRMRLHSPKPLQVSVVSSQRFSPPLSPSSASSTESLARLRPMPTQKYHIPYRETIEATQKSPLSPAHPEDLSTQETNPMWRPW